jgi:hypothetical protein
VFSPYRTFSIAQRYLLASLNKVKIETCFSIIVAQSSKSITGSTAGTHGGSSKMTTEDILRTAQNLDIKKLDKMTPEELQNLSKMLDKVNAPTIAK